MADTRMARPAAAAMLVLGCLVLASCGGDQDEFEPPEPAPADVLNEINERRIEAAQAVERELGQRGVSAHSPIDCGVFPLELKPQRDTRCNVYVADGTKRDVILVTLNAESNSITSWKRAAAVGVSSAPTGWCPGDRESHESAKEVC